MFGSYCKNVNTHKIVIVTVLKVKHFVFTMQLCVQNEIDRIAKSIVSDQTAPVGATSSGSALQIQLFHF